MGRGMGDEMSFMLKSDVRLPIEIVHVVEFDVGNEEQMTKRRKRFEDEGFHVIPVFHPTIIEDYKRMLIRDYDYIGISGLAVDTGRKFYAQQFSKYFLEMRKYQTKVHGFGMTQQEPMRRMPFYSVDSTSWLSGSRYGMTYEFRNGQLRPMLTRECENDSSENAKNSALATKDCWLTTTEWLTNGICFNGKCTPNG